MLRPARRTAIMILFILSAIVLSPRQVHGQNARDVLKPVVTRVEFSRLVDEIGLTRDQRMIIDFLFQDYADSYDQLVEETDETADTVGRSDVRAALAGRLVIRPERMTDLRIAVEDVYLEALPKARRLFDDLIIGVHDQLIGEQPVAYGRAVQRLYRQSLLHARRSARTDQRYAGDGVDMIQLVDEAMRADGELAGIDVDRIENVLAHYAIDMHTFLSERDPIWREAHIAGRIARISKDANAESAALARELECWSELDRINRTAVHAIATIASDTLSADVADQWRLRFDREVFPWLFRKSVPDRQIEWMQKQVLAEGAMEKAVRSHAEYAAKHRALHRRTIDIMLRARRELGDIMYPMMDPVDPSDSRRRGLYEQMVRIAGEAASLESNASGELMEFLSSTQRRRMRSELRLRR